MTCLRSIPLVLLALAAALSAGAQDEGLDPFLFTSSVTPSPLQQTDLQARSVQLYRFPLSLPLRSLEGHRWGLRLTFPVSLSSYRVEAISDVGRFVKGLGVAAIVPGIQLQLPLGPNVLLRPFAEAGVGKGTQGGGTEVLYGAGLRARFQRPLGHLWLTLGGAALHRKLAGGGEKLGEYSSLEAGVDLQLPLGFSLGSHAARGGLFAIARGFEGLELRREGQEPIRLRRQVEVGVSFSTDPAPRVLKLRLPWFGVSYQLSEVVTGLRIYFAFPF